MNNKDNESKKNKDNKNLFGGKPNDEPVLFPLEKQIGNKVNEIVELFKKTEKGKEFEFIFFGRKGKYLPQEKYIELLNFFATASHDKKYKLIDPENTLDITYQPNMETNMRCTIIGTDKINVLMKKVNLLRNHVVFRILVDLWLKGESNLELMKKEKKSTELVDVNELDFRARLSTESKLQKEEIDQILKLDETSMSKIKYRYKQRTSLYVIGDEKSEEFVRIDLTFTKMAETYKRLNLAIPNYELEIEYGTKSKPNIKNLKNMLKETDFLLKIIQQSNYIITKTQSSTVIDYYKNLLSVDPDKITTSLEARQPITLEIQHVTEELPNKYAVTDKSDGERHFLIIYENKVYFITTNLNVKYTGIILPDNKRDYNGSLLDGELIFIPEENRHLFLVFDCLFAKGVDIRQTISLMERISHADDIIEKCFIFGKQKGFKIGVKKWKSENFNLDKKIAFHIDELKELTNVMNHDINIEKQYPLIRRKYFICATGGKDWEIFTYASALWNSFTVTSDLGNKYYLDGLIFQPLEQSYATTKKDNRFPDFKWKPPEKNSIDFYLEFEKDQNNKIMTVYDNSRDDLDFLRNKPYKIAKLYVGQQNKGTEVPILFKEEQELYLAYIFLTDGEVRDLDGNIISDKTVIEAYYNDDPTILDKFRWVPIRTRHDKTESVIRFNKKYGNYNTVADKVWRSIVNPILMSDFDDLAKGNNPSKNLYFYQSKIAGLRSKIGHELIVSAAKENVYFQQRTNLAKPMRQVMNWIKDEIIWTFCHPMYQDNRQLSVLDLGCGKGQDIMKWFYARISFYVGIDLDREGIVNQVDGAMSRYAQLKKRPNFPKMYYLQSDFSAELDSESQKSALNIKYLEHENLYNKFFSKDQSKRTLFDRISCQLAIHYMLKNEISWTNFKNNINGYLRNNGYFFATTFDAEKVMKLLDDKEKYTQYYTDENGKSKILFEIVRKYEPPKDNNVIMGIGNPIDVYIAWFSLEGRYLTEYLVDSRYLVKDLKESCNLELISTDSCENQLVIHKDFLLNYTKFEDVPETRKFLSNVSEFYKSNSVNDGCRIWLNLFRYYVFRKGSKLQKQKGGNLNKKNNDILEIASNTETNVLDFSDTSKFTIPEMTGYNNEFSCTNSIHHIMRSHKIIPKSISPQRFFSDIGIGSIKDTMVDEKIEKIAKSVIVKHTVENGINSEKTKDITMINGINIFLIERDCNDNYDVDFIKKSNKINDDDSAIILMKEGSWYVPVYYSDPESHKKFGLFEMSHDIIKKLFEEV